MANEAINDIDIKIRRAEEFYLAMKSESLGQYADCIKKTEAGIERLKNEKKRIEDYIINDQKETISWKPTQGAQI